MKRIYLTIDTERHYVIIEQINQYIFGNEGEHYYGLKKILKIADKLDIQNADFHLSDVATIREI